MEEHRQLVGFDFTAHEKRKPLQSIDTPFRGPWLNRGLQSSAASSILGKGSFGTVVRALYKGDEIAVKVVKKQKSVNSKSLENERNAIELKHPNIVKVMRVVNEDFFEFGLVLMENCPSVNLQRVIDDSAFEFTERTRLRYLMDISNALKYCHAKGIVHLDVKPQNVLVFHTKNQCKLCDFGKSSKVTSNLNSKYACPGTIAYSAPELFCGQKPTEKADVYSFGIVMWQLQTREIPYFGLKEDTVIYKVVSQQMRPCGKFISRKSDCKYVNTYNTLCEDCWQTMVIDRPSMNEVNLKLYEMLSTG